MFYNLMQQWYATVFCCGLLKKSDSNGKHGLLSIQNIYIFQMNVFVLLKLCVYYSIIPSFANGLKLAFWTALRCCFALWSNIQSALHYLKNRHTLLGLKRGLHDKNYVSPKNYLRIKYLKNNIKIIS